MIVQEFAPVLTYGPCPCEHRGAAAEPRLQDAAAESSPMRNHRSPSTGAVTFAGFCRLDGSADYLKTQQFLNTGPTESAWKLDFPFIKEEINIWKEV